MYTLHGIGIGGGIAIGRAHVIRPGMVDISRHWVEAADREVEVQHLHAAIDAVRAELTEVMQHLPADAPSEAKALLEVHRLMLDDPMLGFAAQERILDEGLNAQWAWSAQVDMLVEQFNGLDDDYLRERSRDVQQIGQRVLIRMNQQWGKVSSANASEQIIVAHDLSPAELLHWKGAAGFAIDLGGVNSHTAIVARSLQRAAVIGLADGAQRIEDGQWLIVDGQVGDVIVAPSEAVLEAYVRKQSLGREHVARRRQLIGVPACTSDGRTILLQANIELPEEAQIAHQLGAEGIGLFRSEFLFLDRAQLPTEDEQFESYRKALLAMKGKAVTIRTIDVGADKALPLQRIESPPNPALGERAIRFSLRHPDIFVCQLRALLRASAFGPLRILIPMLAHRFEVEQTKTLLDQARQELRREGVAMADHVPLGAMIEIPAAAIEADWFASELDFLSIGTNDLVQYTLAVDRMDHQVAQLYDSHHPAVLSLIRNVVQAANKYNRPLNVCGEMAGNPDSAAMLVDMGLRQLSMQSQALLAVKERILQM
jgi:phosphoenolpyruvate-protein phosphotransferase (PTS system enzyme I)